MLNYLYGTKQEFSKIQRCHQGTPSFQSPEKLTAMDVCTGDGIYIFPCPDGQQSLFLLLCFPYYMHM